MVQMIVADNFLASNYMRAPITYGLGTLIHGLFLLFLPKHPVFVAQLLRHHLNTSSLNSLILDIVLSC